jgi:hypothetical protein
MESSGEMVNGIKVDRVKVQRMLEKLVMSEKVNIKTKQYNDMDMVKKIKKMIEEEVECY